MLREIKRTNTIIYLTIGYAVSVILFSIVWFITSTQIDDHDVLITTSEQSTKKMQVYSSLVDLIRKRAYLAQQMILTDDPFEKDEISQSMYSLASDFIVKRRELNSLDLNSEEKAILESQLILYPSILKILDLVSDLTLEESQEANSKAIRILINEVVPTQGLVIDGFLELSELSKNSIRSASQEVQNRRSQHEKVRIILLVFIFITSVLVLYLVIRNVLNVENQLFAISRTDALTGLLNRRSFDENIKTEWNRSLRTGKSLSLLLIDVDYFKNYNDLYGHQEGDNCLKSVAKVLENVAHRSDDIVTRYGGEEFAMILPNVDEPGAGMVADRLLKQVRMENIPHEKSEIKPIVTVSIGHATIIANLNQTYQELIDAADNALYQSKHLGRDRATKHVK